MQLLLSFVLIAQVVLIPKYAVVDGSADTMRNMASLFQNSLIARIGIYLSQLYYQ